MRFKAGYGFTGWGWIKSCARYIVWLCLTSAMKYDFITRGLAHLIEEDQFIKIIDGVVESLEEFPK